MSLNWDLTEVKDHETVCWKQEHDGEKPLFRKGEPVMRLWALTENLIFNTMHVGIPRITEENAQEFHERLQALFEFEACSHLTYFKTEDSTRPSHRIPTLDEIKLHIGLSANAARISKRSFAAKLRRIEKQVRKEMEVFPEDYEAPGKMNSLTALAQEVR